MGGQGNSKMVTQTKGKHKCPPHHFKIGLDNIGRCIYCPGRCIYCPETRDFDTPQH